MRYLLIYPIKFYRYLISPLLGHHCRFNPSCSAYAMMAIERFGIIRGSLLAVQRICKCHPWHPGGNDPVPENIWKHKNG